MKRKRWIFPFLLVVNAAFANSSDVVIKFPSGISFTIDSEFLKDQSSPELFASRMERRLQKELRKIEEPVPGYASFRDKSLIVELRPGVLIHYELLRPPVLAGDLKWFKSDFLLRHELFHGVQEYLDTRSKAILLESPITEKHALNWVRFGGAAFTESFADTYALATGAQDNVRPLKNAYYLSRESISVERNFDIAAKEFAQEPDILRAISKARSKQSNDDLKSPDPHLVGMAVHSFLRKLAFLLKTDEKNLFKKWLAYVIGCSQNPKYFRLLECRNQANKNQLSERVILSLSDLLKDFKTTIELDQKNYNALRMEFNLTEKSITDLIDSANCPDDSPLVRSSPLVPDAKIPDLKTKNHAK